MARRATKRQPPSPFEDLSKQVEKAWARGEKRINRAFRTAVNALPAPQRRAVKQFTGRVEKAAGELDKRRRRALKTVEKAATDLGKRRQRTLRSVDKQREDLISGVERRAAEVVRPFVRSLDVASRRDLERLQKRLAQVERKLARRGTEPAAAQPL